MVVGSLLAGCDKTSRVTMGRASAKGLWAFCLAFFFMNSFLGICGGLE